MILRQLGFEPQIRELESFINTLRNKGKTSLCLPDFLEIIQKLMKKMDFESKIMKQFLFVIQDEKVSLDEIVQTMEVLKIKSDQNMVRKVVT